MRVLKFPWIPWMFLCGILAGEGHAASTSLQLRVSSARHLDVKALGDGSHELVTLGVDPHVEFVPWEPGGVTEDEYVLAFEYFSPQGVEGLEVYYGPPMTPARRVEAGSLVRAESWLPAAVDLRSLSAGKWSPHHRVLRLDFGSRAGLTLRVRNFQLRAPTASELQSAEERVAARHRKLERESRLNAYYEAVFPDRVGQVRVRENQIEIQGNLEEARPGRVLLEWRPHVSMGDEGMQTPEGLVIRNNPGISEVQILPDPGPFVVRVPFLGMDGDNRITSRWVLAERHQTEGWKLLSHARHVGIPVPEGPLDRPLRLASERKGMGGVSAAFPLEELLELGVKHITINMPISHLLDVEPGPGTHPVHLAGRGWHVDERRFRVWDELARFAVEHDIVATGILLVNFQEDGFGRMLIHPEADRAGHYAMPNLTSADGVIAYEAVLELLSRRYGTKGSAFGHVSHWILHNEIGYGWEWTNMGKQPPMLYMDHYLRSMRLAHDVMRRRDPDSRVFISLTHHWNTPSDPEWKSYSNRDLLDRLLTSSRLEGDFAWGVAYHPYPQNLRRPDAWNDTRVDDTFDTPLITPKNIAVLDRWMHQPEVLDSRGRLRPVFLSEQGVNMPDDSEAGRRFQAAGLAYMWRQLDGLESIRAFHYHRWVDHPGEGGLLLGLRGLPSKGRPYGGKKPAWDVYQALGTPRETVVLEPFRGILEGTGQP